MSHYQCAHLTSSQSTWTCRLINVKVKSSLLITEQHSRRVFELLSVTRLVHLLPTVLYYYLLSGFF